MRSLISAGVSKEDIFLGFHAPYKRQFTDFAVG
ncbi:MAG: XisI protein [Nostoc sp. NMS1]|nr:XisI protein [Nostoc sp. NMS1]MBN3990583.1 XisI protein [Nostoc sp. NMS2]